MDASSALTGSAMTNKALQRIQREFQDLNQSEEASQNRINIEIVSDILLELKGEIAGPPDTPYDGGRFELKINVPKDYPFDPPKVRFVTKIWHPNISSVTGAICIDILKDQWVPTMSLRTMLLSLQILLAVPEPRDPQDAVVAKQCLNYPEMFNLTARHWTQAYAGALEIPSDFDDKIRTLVNMGVSEVTSRAVLSGCSWNLEQAIDSLFG